MVKRHNRLLVAYHVISDALLGMTAFLLAYAVRFESGLIPLTKGHPPLGQYLNILPFVGVLVPFAFHVQGLYRLRRGRSRVDDFFAVFVGTILAVVFGIVATLYFQAYYVPDEVKDRGAYEVSQLVWAIFLPLNVVFAFASREVVREWLERRWRAGIGLKRILIAGAGERGRLIDVKVVPDLLQVIALKARLEDLDGIPIININDVPLQGFNSALKRSIDIGLSAAALLVLAIPFAVTAIIIRLTSSGPVFYRQERMGLDGKSFLIYKFRSMYIDAERETGPVFASHDDPRCTPVGRVLRRTNIDELPQLWNVLRGDMSLVGPRPERPFFVSQFKQ